MNDTPSRKHAEESYAALQARVEKLEAAMGRIMMALPALSKEPQELAIQPTPEAGADPVGLMIKLARLTIKRHAVLTATLAGLTQQRIAQLMGCDEATVRLHLRNALMLLGIASRDDLLTQHANMLDGIASREYQTRFGLSKTWWRDKNDPALQSLKPTKQAANQHTKAGRSNTKQ